MPDFRRRIATLRRTSLGNVPRLVFRKIVYRKVSLGRYGVRAGSSVAPPHPCPYRIEFLDTAGFEALNTKRDYLTADDLETFRRQDSVSIVVFDGEIIAANSWMTRGEVYVHELHRTIHVPATEHFSCRSFVDTAYRGAGLLGHMIHQYSTTVEPSDEVWGLVYEWNVASVRTLEKLGWRLNGYLWTVFLVGRKRPGVRRFPATGPTVEPGGR